MSFKRCNSASGGFRRSKKKSSLNSGSKSALGPKDQRQKSAETKLEESGILANNEPDPEQNIVKEPEPSPNAALQSDTSNQPKEPNKSPKKKAGLSLKSLSSIEDDLDDDEDELESAHAVVSIELFLEHWQQYAEMVNKKGKSSLFMAMTNGSPELIAENTFRIKVATETLKETILSEKIYMLDKFARAFGTTKFEIQVDVEELPEEERTKFLTTPKEKFDHMVKVNPKLRDFMDELGLDFDY